MANVVKVGALHRKPQDPQACSRKPEATYTGCERMESRQLASLDYRRWLNKEIQPRLAETANAVISQRLEFPLLMPLAIRASRTVLASALGGRLLFRYISDGNAFISLDENQSAVLLGFFGMQGCLVGGELRGPM